MENPVSGSDSTSNGNGSNGNGNGHNGRGRPSTFKPIYCKRLIDFMSDTSSCAFPTLEKFAFDLGMHTGTLVEWTKQHEDFRAAYGKAKEIQRHNLILGGLTEKFNASFSKFVGVNLGMISENSQQKVELSSPQGLQINFVKSDSTGGT